MQDAPWVGKFIIAKAKCMRGLKLGPQTSTGPSLLMKTVVGSDSVAQLHQHHSEVEVAEVPQPSS